MKNLLETWAIHQKMNELLLRDLTDAALDAQAGTKGRTVREQWYHIHNVRLLWFKSAMPTLLEGLVKLEKDNRVSRKELVEELKKSSAAVSKLLESGFNSGRIKGFKPHPEAFLGYLISHESHHRGQIILILKENGHLPDGKVLYGLWEWGVQ